MLQGECLAFVSGFYNFFLADEELRLKPHCFNLGQIAAQIESCVRSPKTSAVQSTEKIEPRRSELERTQFKLCHR